MTPLAAPRSRRTESPAEEARIRELLARMTLPEKVGQLNQICSPGSVTPELRAEVARGSVGSIINEVDVDAVNELQRIAVRESRLGIPLLIGRDVIHGFKTVFPIPLGQAATFDPELVREGARVAALEAAAAGVRWTFAPMVDIGRDPRWGRVAECLGEDPWLGGVLAAAMVRGFQDDDLAKPGSLAACAKHFAGYGACEAGRDYDTTNIPEIELRDVHLPPFEAALDAGVATFMTSFGDVNGVPATANRLLLTQILREEWGFDGFVVSDWESIRDLTFHGIAADDREAAREAALAGVDMDMAGRSYAEHLACLVEEGAVPLRRIDAMVGNVLRVKLRLGLFEEARTEPGRFPVAGNAEHLEAARRAAVRSVVLLKNEGPLLPLSRDALGSIAVVGPMADDEVEQLGTWVFDGDPALSRTPLAALRDALEPEVEIFHARALETTRSRGRDGFAEAVEAATRADATVLFLGEEAVLSGEAHSRADIRLPGAQEALVREIAAIGKPVVLVVMAGRALALEGIVDSVDALLCAWHPGSMAGPAIADLLFGTHAPTGRLPVTFPKVSGQVPIYYARKNSGKPPTRGGFVHLDDLPRRARQDSGGHATFHLDAGYEPLFPFGFGLTYTRFRYDDVEVERPVVPLGGRVRVRATVRNVGERAGEELAQLYVRDLVGSVTRPVRELKGFRRVRLEAGGSGLVEFELSTDDLAFHGRDMRRVTEPGRFQVWIAPDARSGSPAEFEVVCAGTEGSTGRGA